MDDSDFRDKIRGRVVSVSRPVTSSRIAKALDCKPFKLIKEFMAMDVFLSSECIVEDENVHALADRLAVVINISDDCEADDDLRKERNLDFVELREIDRRTVSVSRPVTVSRLAEALDREPLAIIKTVLKLSVFGESFALPDLTAESELEDDIVHLLAVEFAVDITIVDDDGDSHVPKECHVGPKVPPALEDHAELPNEDEN